MQNQVINSLPLIHIYRYRFQFTYQEPLKLPQYPGSAWRGAFGHALKRTVCVVRNTPCTDCMLKSSCAYSYIFETPPPANAIKMRKYNASPHPFVFQFHPQGTGQDGIYAFDLNLFGHGQRHFPYIVHAMQRAGREGIGGGRQCFQLEQIQHIDGEHRANPVFYGDKLLPVQHDSLPALPPVPEKITLQFHTPIRIKQQGKNVTPESFDFAALFGNLLRRVSMLTYFHSDTPLETDFAGLTQQSRTLDFSEKKLHWYDWKRYSSRQQTEMNMGGIVGEVTLQLKDHSQFWPYLWLGQWTHAGKATSMGMGHYSLDLTSLSE